MKSKKVLIICKYFAPYNIVAAVRPTKIAKYLTELEGCQVTVLCQEFQGSQKDTILEKDAKIIDHIVFVKEDRILKLFNKCSALLLKLRGKGNAADKGNSKDTDRVSYNTLDSNRTRIQELILNLYTLHFKIEQHLIARAAFKTIRKEGENNYDLIFSTYNPLADIFLTLKCKKHWKKAFVIQDFRDLMYAEDVQPKSYRRYTEKLIHKIICSVDYITGVSEGILQCMDIPGSKSSVVTNGFDYDDINSYDQSISLDRQFFNVLYTGTVYEIGSDLSPLFEALKNLIERGLILQEKVRINYAGKDYERVLRKAQKYVLENNLYNIGFVSRAKSIYLQKQADILLIATQNTQKETGIATGKIYEYFMVQRPIVGLVSGDRENSLLKQMITEAEAGICVETEVHPKEQSILEEYILERYRIHQEEEFTTNKRYIDQYDYRNITRRIVEIYQKNRSCQ